MTSEIPRATPVSADGSGSPAPAVVATDIVLNLRLEDVEADPFLYYAWMRRNCPIAWVPETKRLWITTWALCEKAGKNEQVFGPPQSVVEKVFGLPNLMAMSPGSDEHVAARKRVDARMRPRAVDTYVETMLRPVAVRFINAIRERGAAELSKELFEPISTRAVADVLGMTDVDDATLLDWYRGYGANLVEYGRDTAAVELGRGAKQAVQEYLEARLDGFRREHDGSVMAHMFRHGMPEGEIRSIEDIIGTLGALILGGFQEPAHATSNTMLGLLSRPEQAAAVAADPALSARAVQEGLRWMAPFGMTSKLTAADVVLDGALIPANTEIAIVLGSANRDETRWQDPEVYDIGRERKSHMSFGFGAHFCSGNYLGRQLAQVIIEEMLGRLPGLRLDPDREPVVHGWVVCGAKVLPAVWDA